MGLKKHTWLNYNRKDDIMDITLRDQTGAKIDNFSCNVRDDKARGKIAQILWNKYGISFAPAIEIEESVNAEASLEAEKKKETKDIDWLE